MKPKIAIIGLGLIGGSLGMAFKKKTSARVLGLTRDKEKATLAVKLKVADYASTNFRGIVEGSNVIFICSPMNLIIPQLKKILQFVTPGTIITDVGSSKTKIVKEAEMLVKKGVFFIGGHPMAGKETTGMEAAESGLMAGKKYILTRTKKTDLMALNTLKALITSMGAKVQIMSPEEHDLAVAGISHMPLAVATALVESVAGAGQLEDEMKGLASSGFKDTTRIASGDPELGKDMFITNKKAILESLVRFKKALSMIEKLIENGDENKIMAKLDEIKNYRDSIYQ